MRKLFVSAFVLAAVFMLATSGLALEKTARQFTGEELGDWNAATTCSVDYYNFCTGWVWIWSDFADGEVFGTVYDSCCGANEAGVVTGSYMYYWTGAVPNYGFTCTHAISAVDAQLCPTATLASTPWLPSSGWNLTAWPSVPVGGQYLISTTIQNDLGLILPTAFPTDQGASTGICWQARAPHTFWYGLDTSPLCPGSALADGGGTCELLATALMSCTVSVEDESWGSIKSLYR